tara:strand:- start:1446 stop:1718 length:273 start_codon:yes stop_codon:yes gene_type:complete
VQKFSERKERIEEILRETFNPTLIKIIDNSHLHAGHKGFNENSKESHLYIKMNSSFFKEMKRTEMHQQVYKALEEEFARGLHALELDLGF